MAILIRGPGELSDMSGHNDIRYDIHAEIDAMLQARDKGLRGGSAILTSDGKEIHSFCQRSLKNMAKHLELDELTMHEKAIGNTYTFRCDDFEKFRQGGKGFKGNWC